MKTEPPYLTHPLLQATGLRHGFFTRQGGVSTAGYASLNAGLNSGDTPARVAENRKRAATALGFDPSRLAIQSQIHSAIVHSIKKTPDAGQQGDGLVTSQPGLACAVLTADCVPVLFADADAGVVAAAHAGWRGAVAGVLENTVAAMVTAGASPASIYAVLGPAIQQPSYQVGPELRDSVLAASALAEGFFITDEKAGHWRFDLPGYAASRLDAVGIRNAVLEQDTCSDSERFFSHRRSSLDRQSACGRLIAIIGISPEE